jgi:heme/copper-type cytochrome/quinol oxidase subunit 3
MTSYGVTRSTQAVEPADAARVAQRRGARPNGFWGMVVFVATEATIFGVLIGSYFYLRFRVGPWPPRGTAKPDWVDPVILTAVLVATSVPMQLAYQAARAARRARAWWLLLGAFVVQTGYLVWALHDFVHELDRTPPHTSAYASINAVLLGADHFHVFLGLLLNLWLLARLATGLTNYRLVGLQATTFYWHAVNVITVAVVLTELSPYL